MPRPVQDRGRVRGAERLIRPVVIDAGHLGDPDHVPPLARAGRRVERLQLGVQPVRGALGVGHHVLLGAEVVVEGQQVHSLKSGAPSATAFCSTARPGWWSARSGTSAACRRTESGGGARPSTPRSARWPRCAG